MISNPRHPHYCTITRTTDADAFSDGTKTIVYQGCCRKYHGSQSTNVSKNIGMRLKYRLSIPGKVKVLAGDEITVEDYGTEFQGQVTEVEITNMGTTVHWEDYER